MDTLPDDLEDAIDYVPRALLWHEIRETLEFKSARVLLMSSHLYDVQLASRLVKCSVIESMSAEVVNHALKEGNEEIILYLSTQECFDFKEHAQDAFVGRLANAMDTISHHERYPLSTFQLLCDPSLALELDFPEAMEHAIEEGWLDVVQFLAPFEETDVTGLYQNYLVRAIANSDGVREDIFLFLIGLEGVEVYQDLMDELLGYTMYEGGSYGFYNALLENPKTRAYVLAYTGRHDE